MTAPARFLIHHHPATDTTSEGFFLWDGPAFVANYVKEYEAVRAAGIRAKDGDKLNFVKGGVMHGIEIARPILETTNGK